MVVLGIMSGTSLDGVDLTLVEITEELEYNYKLIAATTVQYTKEWESQLKSARELSGYELSIFNIEFGRLLGDFATFFIQENNVQPDFIASHGHTVFHDPQNGLTLQIGSLHEIASATNIKTVGNFRALDVAKGGEGAPLVPIGDALLFSDYDFCLNLGGISNYSHSAEGVMHAEDLTPCNIVANYFAQKMGQAFDEDGAIGSKGIVHTDLLNALNLSDYYFAGTKSMSIEMIEAYFLPIFDNFNINIESMLATFYEHVALKVGSILTMGKTLVTGGGGRNSYLFSRIQHYSASQLVLPEESLIDFKEAIIFAFLGYLRINNKTNVLSSVTGASSDSCSGDVVLP